jgi:hypothetical protein
MGRATTRIYAKRPLKDRDDVDRWGLWRLFVHICIVRMLLLGEQEAGWIYLAGAWFSFLFLTRH